MYHQLGGFSLNSSHQPSIRFLLSVWWSAFCQPAKADTLRPAPVPESGISDPVPKALGIFGGVSGVSAPKIKKYKSPAEWLDMLSPPKCKFVLNNNDHRWGCVWRHQPDFWIGELKFKHFSRCFDSKDLDNVWEKLKEVHARAWEKYSLAAAEIGHCEAQTPGHIPPEVIEGLKPAILALPEKIVYKPLKV